MNNNKLKSRKSAIDHIIKFYLFRDSDVVSCFHDHLSNHMDTDTYSNISRTTWKIIYYLCSGLFSGRQVSVSDIYQSIGVSKTAVIRYLNRLETWGIVEKIPDTVDKRRKVLTFSIDFENKITAAIDQCSERYNELINEDKPSFDDNIAVSVREKLTQFDEFSDISAQWFWETDTDHRFVWFSESLWKTAKQKPNHIYGQQRWEAHLPLSKLHQQEMELHKQDLEAHRPFYNFIYRVLFHDGSISWLAVNGKPFFDDHGEFKGYLGTGRDVTDRRELVEDLRSNRNRLNVFSTLSSDFAWELDADLTYKWVSGSYNNWTGDKDSKAIGKVQWYHCHPRSDNELQDLELHKANLMAHRPFKNFNYREDSGLDGKDVWYQSSGIPMFDLDGEFSGYQGVSRDVTQLKTLEVLSLRQNEILEGIILGKPVQVLVRDTLNLCNLFRPKAIASIFMMSAAGYRLIEGDCGNSEDIENGIENALSSWAGHDPQYNKATFRLIMEANPRSKISDWWATPFIGSTSSINGFVVVEVDRSVPLGPEDHKGLAIVTNLMALLSASRQEIKTQNVN